MSQLQSIVIRTILMLVLTLGASHAVHAATTIYGIRGNTGPAGTNDIIQLDSASGAVTLVYNGYPGGNAATIAQCPNGLIYYAINAGVFQLYVFNPQTPTTAPAVLGPGLGQGALRMACSPGGVLYYMTENATNNLRVINTTTGVFTGAGVTVTGAIEGTGGDMAFDSTGTLFGFNNASNLFTIPLGGGAVTQVGTGAITGLTGAGIGLAFTDTNGIRVLTNASPGFYSVNTGTNPPSATSLSSPPGGAATGDLASIDVTPPDLSITKTANISSVAYGLATSVIYTIVVTNNSTYEQWGTVTDTFPAGVSAVTWVCAASGGSSCVASGSGNINTVATLAAGGTATYTVSATITANTTASVVNTASVALPFALTDATPANNTASNTISVLPRVSKVFGADFGSAGNTSLTITLAYGASVTTTSVFSDALPASPGAMTVNTAGSTGTCPNVTAAAGSGTISMASGTVIPAGGCTIVVSVTATTVGTYTNTIAAGTLTTNVGSNPNVATDSVDVTAVPIITKSFSPASIASGGKSTLTITLTNPGPVAMTNATFIDVFPTSPGAMTVAAVPPPRVNNCGGQLRDSNDNSLGTGDVGIRVNNGTIPANGSCTITLGVTASVAGVYTNTIAVGALSTSAGSNTVAANATLTVGMLPAFTVAKTVSVISDPVNGGTTPKAIPGAIMQYSILVTNSGVGTATDNTTVITDPIPANTQLYVGDLANPAGPIAFVNGTPSSGLTYNFTSLADGADDVSFSNSITGCSPFNNFTPTPAGDGFAAGRDMHPHQSEGRVCRCQRRQQSQLRSAVPGAGELRRCGYRGRNTRGGK